MRIAILFLLLLPLCSCGQAGSEDKIFQVVDKMPEFPGGPDALLHYIISHTHYPPEARRNGIEGTVDVQFVVDSNGRVTDVKVIRPVDPLLDAEAMRVVSHFPKWIPGENGGKKANIWYAVPIHFRLK